MLKLCLTTLCIIATAILSGKFAYSVFALIELLLIFSATHLIAVRFKKTAYIFNLFFTIILLLQQASVLFASDYVSVIMLENMGEYNALGASIVKYAISVLIIICVAVLPHKIPFKLLNKKLFWSVFAIYFLVSATILKISDKTYPPCFSFATTTVSYYKSKILYFYYEKQYKNASTAKIFEQFYKKEIEASNIDLCKSLGEKPNVIVIFTEGMSAEVIDKFNNLNLNLTPNLDLFYENSLVFDNYYNHTAATYRGLRGQLFSSHQYLGGYHDNNAGFAQISKDTLMKRVTTKMVSIIDILNENGYSTFFINCEQKKSAHYNYLETFRCTNIISGNSKEYALSDKEAFALLADTMVKLPQPFFCGFYNLGTHVGFDSPDAKYKNGKNYVFNKFYNFDKWFGDFFEKFKNSDIAKNTILIFTADHCAFQAPEHLSAFNSKQRYCVNPIPLMIYCNEIEHQTIDVKGRNSLDLAPTILDILRLNNHENYFLGTSLFIPDNDNLHRITTLGDDFYLTANDTIIDISKKENSDILKIKNYYKISVKN